MHHRHCPHCRLPAAGLAGYLSAVAAAIGVSCAAAWSDPQPPATAYLPYPHRSPERPERDLLLVWGEQDGWLIAVDTAPTESPIVLTYLGEDILPTPDAVSRFVTDMSAGRRPGQLQPPGFREIGSHDELATRLAAYPTARLPNLDLRERRAVAAEPG